ncbi:MAG: tetratricopeptide repeat protein [Actinomycetota bacterium]|nr:tetratricopeptide repeat protein [Actinomycetota bacterium]
MTAALQVNEHVGDDAGQALALSWLGQLAFDEGDFETAERLLTRSLLIRRRIRHMRGVVITLISLGRVAAERGQIDTAGRLLAEAEQLCRKRADRVGTAMILAQQAQVEMASGSPEKAVTTMSEALPMLVNVGGYGVAIACALRDLGEAQVLAGMAVLGGATLAEAADGFDRSGYAEEAQRCRKLSSRSGRSDE